MINFVIAGAFHQFDTIALFFLTNKDILKKFKFVVYDGLNNCKWNGGRINRNVFYKKNRADFYYKNKIGIALTFTNPDIFLKCPVGNDLLEKFHREGNTIILINDELREYIRDKYPKYKLTYSITGIDKISVPMSDSDFERYKKLEEKYDLIVPRSEHIFDDRFKDLDPSKYEIMLNDTCIYNCPHYTEHFKRIAKQNLVNGNPWEIFGEKSCLDVEECWLPRFNFNIGDKKAMKEQGNNYGMDLKKNQIERLINVGIKNLKISGREMSSTNFKNELKSFLDKEYEIEE